ncbi:invasion associated locus B family protein [Amaricoccus solimangrovi]|uniref:Invasion associated locus B family protein n=1 Tax=Amaricoccus solimangrovi TaxID=2589815 RepID=A0A501WT15_9RHOB|nr:invasion associated locus B family protein [Amaricoccus solimangrovi]TPE52508.1 hypothetical protein FJM51_04830 [Amaricoccus solimangrovi]
MRGSSRLRRTAWALLLAPLLAAPAAAAPPIVPPLVPVPAPPPAKARFRDWSLACAGGCRALTRLRSAASDAPEVLRLSVALTGKDIFALTLRTPAPLYLPDPAILSPDQGSAVAIPWFTCGPRGCEARLSTGPELIDTLRSGRSATVEFTLVDGSRARLRLSLLGLTAALRALGTLSPPPVTP